VERIYLNNKSIGGCLGCDKCLENPNEIACVQKDDAIDIMGQMISSEVILYASPIYFWGFSAQIKALIDRIVDYYLTRKSGELYIGGCSVPDALPEGVKDEALELARSLVR
jgi:multimeric flavodoxin WrbA